MRISDWSSDVCSSDLPFSGIMFVFRCKRADRIKLLLWDGTGLVLVTKRLETGTFRWPRFVDDEAGDGCRFLVGRSEEHTSGTPVTNVHLVCRLLLEKKKHRVRNVLFSF